MLTGNLGDSYSLNKCYHVKITYSNVPSHGQFRKSRTKREKYINWSLAKFRGVLKQTLFNWRKKPTSAVLFSTKVSVLASITTLLSALASSTTGSAAFTGSSAAGSSGAASSAAASLSGTCEGFHSKRGLVKEGFHSKRGLVNEGFHLEREYWDYWWQLSNRNLVRQK